MEALRTLCKGIGVRLQKVRRHPRLSHVSCPIEDIDYKTVAISHLDPELLYSCISNKIVTMPYFDIDCPLDTLKSRPEESGQADEDNDHVLS